MKKSSNVSFSLGKKIYLFVGLTVFTAAMFVAIASHFINANRIDTYFKGLSMDTARNFSNFVDVEFLRTVRAVAESEEFQAIRNEAEENEDEASIEAYLREKGLLDEYDKNREILHRYLSNMNDVKYLYVVVWGWLCSAFVPVYSDDGTWVCSVGCDVGMDDIMAERRNNFIYIVPDLQALPGRYLFRACLQACGRGDV